MAVISSVQVVPSAQQLGFQGSEGRTRLQKPTAEGKAVIVHEVWGYALHPVAFQQVLPLCPCVCWLLHPCQGLKTDSKQGEVTMTSGLTTTSTFSTTNTLLQPDFWQEKQVPCLRFPFKDFSQPSFNSASYSITQRKEAFSLSPSCSHATFWTGALFCPIWARRSVSSGVAEVLLCFFHMPLYLPFPLTFSLVSSN